jgi:hypothetical protein
MPKIPTTLGNPTVPQAGSARRVSGLNSSNLAGDYIEGSRIYGQTGHATAAGLQTLGNAFDALQLQQDKKEAKDWLNQLMLAKTDLLYGDGTGKNPGYINTKGDAAVKGAAATSQQLDKMREQFLAQVSNKQVGELFDAASTQLIMPDKEEILKHASKENLVALDFTDNGTIAAATDQLAANPTSDQVEKNSTALIAGSVFSMLDRRGITDPVARNQAALEAVSKAKAAAIETALVRDPLSGQALYAKWKDSIQGVDQAAIEQSIVAAEDRWMRKQEHALLIEERNIRRMEKAEEERLTQSFLAGTLTLDDIYISKADPSTKRVMASALDTQIKEGQNIVGDASLFIETFKRLSLPKDDPMHISDRNQYVGLIGKNGLSVEQINQLDSEYNKIHKDGDAQQAELKKQWLKTVIQELSGENELLGLKDPKGQRSVGNALMWGLQQYDKLKAQGLSDLEIYNPNSPRADSLYNGINQFKRPPAEYFQDLFEANPGNATLAVDKANAQNADAYENIEGLKEAYSKGIIDKKKFGEIAKQKGWAQ